ncbi:TMEM175 family protein, partial [Enterococcus faecalis]|uniref:TMEM175 family protein n=1 Tax=Enterococcus faecalis TaxID=1351 RepID=UPI003D6A209E
WTDLYQLYSGRVTGFVLSFVIAGIFWFSHQRRLARQPYASRNVVFLNLLFLLSIILLPVTNSLDGSYGESRAVAVLFGLHLTAIAGLNSVLW